MRSDYYTIPELRKFESMIVSFFFEQIHTYNRYFSPLSIRNQFLKQLEIDNNHKEDLKQRLLRYTSDYLVDLVRIGAVTRFTKNTYQIVDKTKIKKEFTVVKHQTVVKPR